MGYYAPTPLFADETLIFPTAPSQPVGRPRVAGVRRLPEDWVFGDLTVRLPRPPAQGLTLPGVQAATVFDDYYNTIHVNPVQIFLGDISGAVSRSVEVWNSFVDDAKFIDRIDKVNAEGLDATGVSLPFRLGPLRNHHIGVFVSGSGPATIEAYFELGFSNFDDIRYWYVFGKRIVTWDIPPNWSQPYQVTHSFKTEVLVSQDGTEQRLALRNRPRLGYAYTALLHGDRSRDASRLLSTWQNQRFAMPDWAYGVHTRGSVLGGAELSVDEMLPVFAPGELVIVIDNGVAQSFEIEAVDEETSTLRFTSPLAQAFSSSAILYPGVRVRSESSIQSPRFTSAVGTMQVRFMLAHISKRLELQDPPKTWRGLELFERKPNWGEQATVDFVFDYDERDSGRGYFDGIASHLSPKSTRKQSFTLYSRDEVEELMQFFYRCKGRRGEFYAPTWDEDIVMNADTLLFAGTSQMTVTDTAMPGRFESDRVYRNIVIRLADGEYLYRRIDYATSLEDGPTIVFTETWPRTIRPSEIVSISWLPRWRLGSDDLTVAWATNEVATITLSMQVLPDMEDTE